MFSYYFDSSDPFKIIAACYRGNIFLKENKNKKWGGNMPLMAMALAARVGSWRTLSRTVVLDIVRAHGRGRIFVFSVRELFPYRVWGTQDRLGWRRDPDNILPQPL